MRGGLSVDICLALTAGELNTIGGRRVPEHVDFNVCKRWVRDCSQDHSECARIEDIDLPTRLLDLGSVNGTRDLKLAVTEDGKGQYAALSHTWGDRKPPVTNLANFSDRLELLECDRMPQTFQDAICTVRALGFRYLWIDSLCIIQDDRGDWDRECPRMTSVYQNAALTIAGPEAQDVFAGFLHPRSLQEPAVELAVTLNNGQSGTLALFFSRTSSKYEPPRYFEGEDVLASRAWVLQERLLSQRILYFGRRQMYFECNSSLAAECFRYPTPGLVMEMSGMLKDKRIKLIRHLAQYPSGLQPKTSQFSVRQITRAGGDCQPICHQAQGPILCWLMEKGRSLRAMLGENSR
jgi:hypothetical protein